LVVFDVTGSDEVALTAGNTYAFEVEQTDNTSSSYANPMFLYRAGASDSIYPDGTMFRDRVTVNGAAPFRDPIASIYLTAVAVPEASAFWFGAIVASIVSIAVLGQSMWRTAMCRVPA